MKYTKQAFTLIELIVVITILAILWTIAFISLQWYSRDARNSVRISDIKNIEVALELFSLSTGKYPLPWNTIDITWSWGVILWKAWTVDSTVLTKLQRVSELPTDPKTGVEMQYSTTNNRKEYELKYEMELAQTDTVIQTTYAESTMPYVHGTYNGLYLLWSDNIYYSVPSLHTSTGTTVENTVEFELNNKKVNYQVSQLTHSWVILRASNLSNNYKNFWLALKTAYEWTPELNDGIYMMVSNLTILTAQEFWENLTTWKLSTTLLWCDEIISGWTKDFYDTNGVAFWQTCDTHKKTFTCNDGVWFDWVTSADTSTYSQTSCTVAWDTNPPTGWSFTINNNDTSTATTSVTLNITCPTDPEWSTPIQMAYWDTASPTNWETCVSSKAYTLPSWDGTKTVYMRFKDGLDNTTNDVSDSITLATTVSWSCTGLPTNAWYYNSSTSYSLSSASAGTTLNAVTAWYQASPSNNTCQWKCQTGFMQVWNSCVNLSNINIYNMTFTSWTQFSLAQSICLSYGKQGLTKNELIAWKNSKNSSYWEVLWNEFAKTSWWGWNSNNTSTANLVNIVSWEMDPDYGPTYNYWFAISVDCSYYYNESSWWTPYWIGWVPSGRTGWRRVPNNNCPFATRYWWTGWLEISTSLAYLHYKTGVDDRIYLVACK